MAARREKDVTLLKSARGRRTKTSNLTTKILPGSVERRMVRCGKANCKCTRGELHGPYFYHVTTDETVRSRRYIPRAEVAVVAQACQEHRELQAQLLAGRKRYKLILAAARQILE